MTLKPFLRKMVLFYIRLLLRAKKADGFLVARAFGGFVVLALIVGMAISIVTGRGEPMTVAVGLVFAGYLAFLLPLMLLGSRDLPGMGAEQQTRLLEALPLGALLARLLELQPEDDPPDRLPRP